MHKVQISFSKKLLILFSVSFLSFSFSTHAFAEMSRYCNELKGGAKIKCKLLSSQKCARLKGYWDKRKCETAIVKQLDPCGSSYLQACKRADKIYWNVCRRAGELNMNQKKSIRNFMIRVLVYEKLNKKYQAFHSKYSSCMSPRNRRCKASRAWSRICSSAGLTFKRTYAKEVNFFLDRFARGKMRSIKRMLQRRQHDMAGVLARELLVQSILFAKLDKVSFVSHRSSEVKVMNRKIQKLTSFLRKRERAKLASRRCPRGKNNIRRVVRVLRPHVTRHFRVYDKSHKLKTRVKALRLNGRRTVRKYYRRGQRITIVSYPAIACVEKRYPKKRVCRWYSISVRRKRVGRRWGNWRTYIGRSQEILCKNAR